MTEEPPSRYLAKDNSPKPQSIVTWLVLMAVHMPIAIMLVLFFLAS